MKLLPTKLVAETGGAHEHGHHEDSHEAHEHSAHGAPADAHDGEGHDHHGDGHGGHDHAAAGGIEWEDDMVEVNRLTTPANMRWKLIDRETGAENAAIDWRLRVGDRVKIELQNEMNLHSMKSSQTIYT